MQMRGAVAVVSGGASGLGEAVVRRLAGAGAQVVIADVAAEKGEALAAELGPTVTARVCDVSDADQVGAAIAHATGLGPLRAVVSCAGIAIAARTVDKNGVPHDAAAFARVVQINLIGSFHMARLGAAAMVAHTPLLDQQRGAIVLTSSIAAYDGQMGQVAYTASKGGVVAMTLPLARDLAPHGIRVCTVCPGIMDTPLLAGLPEPARTALEASIPLPRRLGAPAEFAALVGHMIDNDYLNGECIRIDGALRMGPR